MTIQKQIDEAIEAQTAIIAKAEKAIEALRLFDARYPDLELSSARVVFLTTISTSTIPRVTMFAKFSRKSVGGKWEKNVNSDGRTIHYVSEKEFAPGLKFRLWSAEPPPSCKLVEEEVEVPAHREKRWKMVCPDVAAINAPAFGVA